MTGTYLEKILDPWREFDRMNRIINRAASEAGKSYPFVNVWVNGENAVITSEIPGVDLKTIDITVSGNSVAISGVRPKTEVNDDESYHRHEIRSGEFSKTIKLPFNVDPDKVRATYKKGVLHIALPQLEADKPKKITIQSE